MDILFPAREAIDPFRDGITFPAVVNGVAVQCTISREALEDHFGADLRLDMESSFKQNRPAIEYIAEKLILADSYDADKVIVIRTADIR